jgi:imidazolonepropionase-like amidohydrolase
LGGVHRSNTAQPGQRRDGKARGGERLHRPPILVAYDARWLEGKAFGLGPPEFDKIEVVRSGGLKSPQIMRDAGLPVAFGSDLLSGLRKHHCMEFELLARC